MSEKKLEEMAWRDNRDFHDHELLEIPVSWDSGSRNLKVDGKTYQLWLNKEDFFDFVKEFGGSTPKKVGRAYKSTLTKDPVQELRRFNKKINHEPEDFGIKNYSFDDQGRLNVDGDVNLFHRGLTVLPFTFGVVTGDFYCNYNQLTSLQGAPETVGKDFNCGDNKLTSLQGAPKTVGGDFSCNYNQLTSLQGAPETVGKDFKCSYNKLTSLQGAPESVGGDFSCNYNQLTSLQGAPESVGGDFSCLQDKPLKDSEGIHNSVRGQVMINNKLEEMSWRDSFADARKKQLQGKKLSNKNPEQQAIEDILMASYLGDYRGDVPDEVLAGIIVGNLDVDHVPFNGSFADFVRDNPDLSFLEDEYSYNDSLPDIKYYLGKLVGDFKESTMKTNKMKEDVIPMEDETMAPGTPAPAAAPVAPVNAAASPVDPFTPPAPGLVPAGWKLPDDTPMATAMQTGDVNVAMEGQPPVEAPKQPLPESVKPSALLQQFKAWKESKGLGEVTKEEKISLMKEYFANKKATRMKEMAWRDAKNTRPRYSIVAQWIPSNGDLIMNVKGHSTTYNANFSEEDFEDFCIEFDGGDIVPDGAAMRCRLSIDPTLELKRHFQESSKNTGKKMKEDMEDYNEDFPAEVPPNVALDVPPVEGEEGLEGSEMDEDESFIEDLKNIALEINDLFVDVGGDVNEVIPQEEPGDMVGQVIGEEEPIEDTPEMDDMSMMESRKAKIKALLEKRKALKENKLADNLSDEEYEKKVAELEKSKDEMKEAALRKNDIKIKFPKGTTAPEVDDDVIDLAYKVRAYEARARKRKALLNSLKEETADYSGGFRTVSQAIDETDGIPGKEKIADETVDTTTDLVESRIIKGSDKFAENYKKKKELNFKSLLQNGLLG